MRWPCKETLDLFRGAGQCEKCQRHCLIRAPHHMYARGMGDASRLDIPINLISLGHRPPFTFCECHPYQHGDATHGVIDKRNNFLDIIIRREGLEGWYSHDEIWDILKMLVELPPRTTEDELAERGLLRWFLKPQGTSCLSLDL